MQASKGDPRPRWQCFEVTFVGVSFGRRRKLRLNVAYAETWWWGKGNAPPCGPMSQILPIITDGSCKARRLIDHKAAKTAGQMTKDATMTLKRTLTLFALSAVFVGEVSTFAEAEGLDGPSPKPMFNFEQIDSDKDGKITTEEFDAFRAAEFAKADINGDGMVSADELAAKHVADATARAAALAAKMIARMDDNSDGQLSAEEMAQGPRAPTLFERADADGDGAISKEEADAMQDKMGRYGKRHRKG